MVDNFRPRDGHHRARGIGVTADLAPLNHDRSQHDKVENGPDEARGRHANADESAHAHERGINRETQPQLTNVRAQDARNGPRGLGGPSVIVGVEPLMEMPGLAQARPPVHAENPELQELHPAIAHDQLEEGGEPRGDGQEAGLEQACFGRSGVEGIKHHAAGPAFGKGQLLLVDEAPLQGKGHEHPKDGDDDGPKNHLPRRQDPPGHEHVGGKAGGQRCHHIARGRGDGLGAVVLKDCEPTAHRRFLQQAEQGEGDEHRGESHTDGNACLGPDVERGGREDAAQQKSREGRSDRELGHVAPEDMLQPPVVLLGSTQGTDLLVG